MPVSQEEICEGLMKSARELIPRRSIVSDTRICGDLGICDEDMWDLIDDALDHLGVSRPSPSNPALIDIQHRQITFSDLASWIYNYASGFR
jgi:hypothetical protein